MVSTFYLLGIGIRRGTIMSSNVIYSGMLHKVCSTLNQRRAEWSVYDIKVPQEWFESIGSVCSLIALAVLWCHTLIILPLHVEHTYIYPSLSWAHPQHPTLEHRYIYVVIDPYISQPIETVAYKKSMYIYLCASAHYASREGC